jgi:hypothetical protein
MYQKQKMTSTPHVDVEELKGQLRREVLGGLRPILEVQGIQFSDIGGVMSDEERRSSFASIAAGGQPQGEHPTVWAHRGPWATFAFNRARHNHSANNMQPYFIGRRKLSNGRQDRPSVSTSDHA